MPVFSCAAGFAMLPAALITTGERINNAETAAIPARIRSFDRSNAAFSVLIPSLFLLLKKLCFCLCFLLISIHLFTFCYSFHFLPELPHSEYEESADAGSVLPEKSAEPISLRGLRSPGLQIQASL